MSMPAHTVLLVDDDEDTSLLVGGLLRRHGWETTFASNLEEGRSALESGVFTALITDLRLPDGSGLSLLAKGRPPTLRVAVVMTGWRGDRERSESERGGFDAYILKPFDATQLVELLQAHVAPKEPPPVAQSSLCALVADDDDDARFLMSHAFRRAGFEVYEAINGNELVASYTAHATTRTVVVSDIGMPECDGIEATLALKRIHPAAVVLLVTAFVNPATMTRARDAGATQVLNKPLNLDRLVQTALALLS